MRIERFGADDDPRLVGSCHEALGYQRFGRPVVSFEVPAAHVLPAGAGAQS
jgi:hypothetical protein